MAAAFLDKLFAQQIGEIDRRIEETLEEIEKVLKDTPKEALKSGKKEQSDASYGKLTALDRQRFLQCVQKILEFCHSNPSSIDAIFDSLRALAKFGCLKPINLVPQCEECARVKHSTLSKDSAQRNGSNGCSNQKLSEEEEKSTPQDNTGVQTNTAGKDIPKISSDEDLVSVWQCVCYHVYSHIFNELTANPCFLSLHDSLLKKSKWQLYYNFLRVMFSPEQVQKVHRLVRTEQKNHFVCSCFPAKDDADACLSCLCEFCIQCLVEDVSFLSIGYFRPLVVTWRDLQAPYVTTVRGHVIQILAECDWLKSSSVGCNDESDGRCTTSNNMKRYSPRLKCLVDPEACLNRTQNSGTEFQIENNGDERVGESHRHQDGDQYGGHASSASCSSQRRRSTGGFCAKQKRKNSASSCKKIYLEERNLLFNAVLQLVDELAWFDRQLNCICCIDTCGGDLEAETSCSYTTVNGGPFSVASSSPATSPVHEEHGDRIADACLWDWRSTLASHGLVTVLQRGIQRNGLLTADVVPPATVKQPVTVRTTKVDVKGFLTNIFTFAHETVSHLDRFLGTVSASQGALAPFKSSFSHAVHVHLAEVLDNVDAILDRQEADGSLKVLYVALNTSEFLEERIVAFGNALHGRPSTLLHRDQARNSDNSLASLKKRASTTTREIRQLIVAHHLKWLSGCVLQDSGSHDWENDKPFYEGERISFSVQAFHLYMQGTMADLFASVSASRAQEITAEVLAFVLEQFCFRYASARPSPARTSQFAGDLKTLLLSTYEMLFRVCLSPDEVLGSRDGCRELHQDQRAYNVEAIHSHCNALLATLCVGVAPIERLYQAFKRGFPPRGPWLAGYAPWLAFGRTSLFPWPTPGRRAEPLVPSVAVWLAFHLATSRPQPNAVALLRALTTQGCTLSIVLLSEAAKLSAGKDCGKDTSRSIRQLSDAVFAALIQCSHVEDNLADVLIPVIERLDGWKEFDRTSLTKRESERPWWLTSLQMLLAPYVESIVASSAYAVMNVARCSQVGTAFKEVKNEIDTLARGSTKDEEGDECSLFCLAEILSCARDLTSMFPPAVMNCLAKLESHVSSTGIDPVSGSVGLQFLLSMLYGHLKSKEHLRTTFGRDVDAATLSTCSSLADRLSSIVLTAEDASSGENTCPKHLGEVVQHIRSMVRIFNENRKVVLSEDPSVKEGHATDFLAEESVAMAAESLLQTPNGQGTMEYIHKLLVNNRKWVQSSLAIPPLFSTSSANCSEEVPSPAFRLSCSNEAEDKAVLKKRTQCQSLQLNSLILVPEDGKDCDPAFNPLKAYTQIGEENFVQDFLLNFPLEQEKVLPLLADMGITETGFRTLLSNRWEMATSASIPPSLEKCVRVLKTLYSWESSSPSS